jgi:threonine dehydrogenase-like Zn-dependent dehydrogenase
VLQVMHVVRPSGIICLTGVSSGGRSIPVDVGELNRELVLENNVVFGTVNANRRHYEMAAAALAQADRGWLHGVVRRRVPVEHWHEAFERRRDDVKTIVTF